MIGWLFPSRHRAWHKGRLHGQRCGVDHVVHVLGRFKPTGNADFDEGVFHAFDMAEAELINLDNKEAE